MTKSRLQLQSVLHLAGSNVFLRPDSPARMKHDPQVASEAEEDVYRMGFRCAWLNVIVSRQFQQFSPPWHKMSWIGQKAPGYFLPGGSFSKRIFCFAFIINFAHWVGSSPSALGEFEFLQNICATNHWKLGHLDWIILVYEEQSKAITCSSGQQASP